MINDIVNSLNKIKPIKISATQKLINFLETITVENQKIIDDVKRENYYRMQKGESLSPNSKRLSTNQVIAKLAGVGETVVKKYYRNLKFNQ